MQEIDITTFVSFIKHTDVFDLVTDLVVFRGQPVQGNLLPSVARVRPKYDSTQDEIRVLEQLRLQGASMLAGIGSQDLELMVLAQHYGLKTRLLDWTSNPLAALWFACSDNAEGDVYVYALEADKLLIQDVYARSPFKQATTRIFQPRLNNPRIVAQQGWFTLHKFSKKEQKFVSLERNPQVSQFLHQYRIPASRRKELLDALDRHGVSAKTIYPDLGGLCQHLNRKYHNT